MTWEGSQPPGIFCQLSGNYSEITIGDLNMPPPPPPPFFLLWDIKGASWSAWEQRSYSRNLSTATLSARCIHSSWISARRKLYLLTVLPLLLEQHPGTRQRRQNRSNSSFKVKIAFNHRSFFYQPQEAASCLHFKHFVV